MALARRLYTSVVVSSSSITALKVLRLKILSERQAKVVELWFFGGLSHQEIAEVINISLPSVRRDWRLAKAWLSREIRTQF